MKKIDKRSKIFKDSQKALKQSEGLGDTIEKITSSIGLKTLVKAIFGEDCGCEERKIKLNKLFPYRVECLNEDEYNYLDELLPRIKDRIEHEDQKKVLVIYNRVFNTKKQASSCSPCWRATMNDITKLYNEYKKELED